MATDAQDGDLTSSIMVTDTTCPDPFDLDCFTCTPASIMMGKCRVGDHRLRYSVTDLDGNTAKVDATFTIKGANDTDYVLETLTLNVSSGASTQAAAQAVADLLLTDASSKQLLAQAYLSKTYNLSSAAAIEVSSATVVTPWVANTRDLRVAFSIWMPYVDPTPPPGPAAPPPDDGRRRLLGGGGEAAPPPWPPASPPAAAGFMPSAASFGGRRLLSRRLSGASPRSLQLPLHDGDGMVARLNGYGEQVRATGSWDALRGFVRSLAQVLDAVDDGIAHAQDLLAADAPVNGLGMGPRFGRRRLAQLNDSSTEKIDLISAMLESLNITTDYIVGKVPDMQVVLKATDDMHGATETKYTTALSAFVTVRALYGQAFVYGLPMLLSRACFCVVGCVVGLPDATAAATMCNSCMFIGQALQLVAGQRRNACGTCVATCLLVSVVHPAGGEARL